MARPRKNSTSLPFAASPALISWAEMIGEAVGRGVARGLNQALAQSGLTAAGGVFGPRRRGRPPKAVLVAAPPDKRCRVADCIRPARSKGLCSAHYQAERRKTLGA
jgi:hypothetical protein